METIDILELEATCLGVLERVRKTGEPVLVTRRGAPVAQITPAPRTQAKASAFGCMRGTAEQISDIVAPLPLEECWAMRSGPEISYEQSILLQS